MCCNDNCCANGTCCTHACDGCVNKGALSGGTVVAAPDPVCVGATVTFTGGGVVDSGGSEWINCVDTVIPPGGVEYH